MGVTSKGVTKKYKQKIARKIKDKKNKYVVIIDNLILDLRYFGKVKQEMDNKQVIRGKNTLEDITKP
jgi:hypothetical protein